VWTADQLAFHDYAEAEMAKVRPGVQIDLARFDFGGLWPDWIRERIGKPGRLAEAELDVVRQTLARQRAEIAEMVSDLSEGEDVPLDDDGRAS
jgi:hypothetical protein